MSKKIVLVNPKISHKSIIFAVELRNPVPHCLGYMAMTALDKDFDVKVVDENYKNAETVDYAEYDLICMPVRFFGASRARELADQFRKRGKKSVLHCLYPTFASEDALKYADSIMIGEPDNLWKTVLRDFKTTPFKKSIARMSPRT